MRLVRLPFKIILIIFFSLTLGLDGGTFFENLSRGGGYGVAGPVGVVSGVVGGVVGGPNSCYQEQARLNPAWRY
jgi:hypothetical protein